MNLKQARRRSGIQLIHALIATVIYLAPSNTRVRTFGSLCGLAEDGFNPPEKATMYFRLVRKLYRVKRAYANRSANDGIMVAVFHHIGVSRLCINILIQDVVSNNRDQVVGYSGMLFA